MQCFFFTPINYLNNPLNLTCFFSANLKMQNYCWNITNFLLEISLKVYYINIYFQRMIYFEFYYSFTFVYIFQSFYYSTKNNLVKKLKFQVQLNINYRKGQILNSALIIINAVKKPNNTVHLISNILKQILQANMKNFEAENTAHLSIESFEIIDRIKQIKCPGAKLAFSSCFNIQCQNYSFICKDQECQCQVKHEDCLTIPIKKIVRKLKDKVIPFQSLQDIFFDKIQQMINQLSNFRQKIIQTLKKQSIFYALSKLQHTILKLLQTSEDADKVSGKKLNEVILSLMKQESAKIGQNIIKQMKETLNGLNEGINHKQIQIFNYLANIKKMNGYTSHQISQPKVDFFQKSKVISSSETENLIKFFERKNIKQSRLLYRASEDQFSVSKFHEKCDCIPNTLIICKTQFGRIIGGFTTVNWIKTQNIGFVKDQTGASFMFSLSTNSKFEISDKEKAIYRSDGDFYGPRFGDGDLVISNQANKNKHSFANINKSYKNKQYKVDDKKSWQKFCGNPFLNTFSIRQWECWELLFE